MTKILDELREFHPYRKKSDDDYDRFQIRWLEEELEREIERHTSLLSKLILKLITGEISKERYMQERLREDLLELRELWLARTRYELTRDYISYPTKGKSDDISGIAYKSRSPFEAMEFKEKCQQLAIFYQKMASLTEEYLK
jgi:hypothetical protein